MWERGVVGLLAVAVLLVPGSAAAAQRDRQAGVGAAEPFFDSRAQARERAGRAGSTVAAARPTRAAARARASLRSRLGRAGVLRIDPLTGTPHQLLRTDGALSGPRGGDRTDIALDFVRANKAAIGLDESDLDGLDVLRRPTTARGLTVVHFRQLYRGIPAFDNDLRVAIDRAGRVHSVTGAPRPDLAVGSIEPALSGAEALAALRRDVGGGPRPAVTSGPSGVRRVTRFAGDDFARLVLFGTAGGARLAWHVTYHASSVAYYDAVVDASSGAILYRQNLTKAVSNAQVYPNHPGASPPVTVDLETLGLPPNSTRLAGEYARQWADLDDDDGIDAPEETPPSAGTNFLYPFTAFQTAEPECPAAEPCAWDPAVAFSWQANRNQNGVQAFYLVSRFHDHLERPQIGFDAASGNFEQADGDAVRTQTDDGANITGSGLPDAQHRNNANMATGPDGIPPQMQMFLFRNNNAASSFADVNGGDDSGVVWHEYTHGLSNRLVTNADGVGALSSAHAGAMGEGWSDWYASDLQVRDGSKTDTDTAGEIDVGEYTDLDEHALRTQAADCPVGASAAICPGGAAASGTGGYTLGDFGKVFGVPEVHADGEIWVETLWDLRRALGSDTAETLITDGMRLSPPEPSMLDMRNAILSADQANFGGANEDEVWDVFRVRGMGFFASALDGSDTEPVEDFSAPPPAGGPTGTVTGVVTAEGSGRPLAGVRVGFGGHTSGDAPLTGVTGVDGRYVIADVPVGTYPALTFAPAAGFDPAVETDVEVTDGGTTTRNVSLRRDWAAIGGGALIQSVSDDTSDEFGCGVDEAFDQRQGTGWSPFNPDSPRPDNPGTGDPQATVRLPETVDVSAFLIDPANTCGDDETAATREFRIETSTNGSTFRTAVDGRGALAFTSAAIGELNERAPASDTGRATRFVRITLLSPLRTNTGDSGRDFIDLSELEVIGNALPAATLAVSNVNPRVGEAITFDASGSRDADSEISGYDWDFDGDGAVDRTTARATTSFAYPGAGLFTAKVAVKDVRGGSGTATRGVTVSAVDGGPGPTPPTTPPTTPPPVPLPRPGLSIPSSGSGGAIRPRIRCFTRCTVRSTFVVSRKTAHRLKLRKRTIATFRRTFGTSVNRRVRLLLPRKVRRAARRAGLRTLRGTLTVTVRHSGGLSRTARRAVRIRL
jgi:extracellular elastinolytic metalloproteinase